MEIFSRSRCRKVIDSLIRKFILSLVLLTFSNVIALLKLLVYMPFNFQKFTVFNMAYLKGPLPLDIFGLHASVGPPSSA